MDTNTTTASTTNNSVNNNIDNNNNNNNNNNSNTTANNTNTTIPINNENTSTPIRKESTQDKTTVAILSNQIIVYFNHHCNKNNGAGSNEYDKEPILNFDENEHSLNQSNIGITNITINIDKLMKTLLESPISDISFTASLFLLNEQLFQCVLNTILLDSFGSKNDLICKWFYTWYNLNCANSKKFVLSFLPALLWVYLTKCHPTNSNALIGLESCLICMYNQEYIKRGLKEKVFNPPTLSLPSYIFKSDELTGASGNNTSSGVNNTLTENMLKLINTQSKPIVLERALPRIDIITTANRNILFKTIQSVYTQNILLLSIFSRVIFCEMTTRLSGLGYKFIDKFPVCERISKISNSNSLSNLADALNGINNDGQPSSSSTSTTASPITTNTTNTTNNDENESLCNSNHYRPIIGLTNYLIYKNNPTLQSSYIELLKKKRVFLSETIYQEFITALTLCSFQETTKECAKISVQSINERASFDLIPEIILSSNSLLHLLNQKK